MMVFQELHSSTPVVARPILSSHAAHEAMSTKQLSSWFRSCFFLIFLCNFYIQKFARWLSTKVMEASNNYVSEVGAYYCISDRCRALDRVRCLPSRCPDCEIQLMSSVSPEEALA